MNTTEFDALDKSLCWESKPNRYGGDIAYGRIESDIGPLFVAETAIGLCQLDFILHNNFQAPLHILQKNWPQAHYYQRPLKYLPSFVDLKMLVGGETAQQHPALHICATPFQRKVWQLLLAVPAGQVTSYGAIARQLQQPRAAQAVGQAVAANPLGIIVPCHRVLGAGAVLGHYHWGAELKQRLLEAERALL